MNLHEGQVIEGSELMELKIFIEASAVHKSMKVHSGHKDKHISGCNIAR